MDEDLPPTYRSAVATGDVFQLILSERRKLSDVVSNTYDGNKVCFDNVSKDSLNAAANRIAVYSVQPNQRDFMFSIPHCQVEADYSDFIVMLLRGVLVERWMNASSGRVCPQIGGKAYYVRAVREANFSTSFCANFVRYTTQANKPDIAVEIFEQRAGHVDEKTAPSNAVLPIEVKLAETPDPSKLQDGLQQITSYMVTKVRPVKRDGESWLLHGLLLYRAVGFLVTLRSNVWLDYPWECVSIKRFDFHDFAVVELLRIYVCEVLDGTTKNEQLFKLPRELGYPMYPAGTTRLGIQGNVISCKWQSVSAQFPKTEAKAKCIFSKLPQLEGNPDVVLKVVSPTVYPHGGRKSEILSFLRELLLNVVFVLRTNTDVDDGAKQRLKAVENLYLHVCKRGQCKSSVIVITMYRGEPMCTVQQLWATWAGACGQEVRSRFFEQVCRLALDVVCHVRYAHADIRPANIVFDGKDFNIIDFENVRSIDDDDTGVCEKADSTKGDQRYPSVTADNDVVRWLLYTTCQLYMCVYIMDETVQAQRAERACEVEAWFQKGGDCWKDVWMHAPAALVGFRTWRQQRMFTELHNLLVHPPKNDPNNDVDTCRNSVEAVLKSALRIA